ncbi:F0F1 ATP synthase subunit delta [Thorsellia anophelis]|uniref:ATP synthase subunit delta n=1 Tax=Thorsellia anophelis DSM 18579 TaxID=1123402 RepID=A0A1I0DPJ7_9GAMM|nr:F0F1 ATP synthase subunit delta [Thorsellia anophelis]SET34161.1 ATP synthase F1 subcomplex delta subunit [Thorsellia anophelis DSM 18579]
MSDFTTIARPYAKAAFDFALEKKSAGDVQAITHWESMLNFAMEVAQNDQIAQMLTGSLSSEESANLFINICGDTLCESGKNLIKVMAENRRLLALPEVFAQFIEMKTEYEGTIDVEVIAINKLSASQEESIISSMQKRLSRNVKLHCKIDTSIMGGLIIRAGDLVIDSSIRGRLNRLTDVLQS